MCFDVQLVDRCGVLPEGGTNVRCSVFPVTTGSKVTPGGQMSASRPEPQGEVRPNSSEQQVFAALSGRRPDAALFHVYPEVYVIY